MLPVFVHIIDGFCQSFALFFLCELYSFAVFVNLSVNCLYDYRNKLMGNFQ